MLSAHVCASVGWLGLSLCLLTLALNALGSGTGSAAVSYPAMKLLVDWVLFPLALLSWASGLVLALGTHWGLARHRWVWVKFWATSAALVASALAFRAGVNEAYHAVRAGEPVNGVDLVFPPAVSLSLYVFLAVVSVLKPWGLTARGRRHQRARAARRTAPTRRKAPVG